MVNRGHPVELRSFWYRQQPCLVAHDERRQRCILATTTCGKKSVKARCCKMLPEVLTQFYIGTSRESEEIRVDICKWPLGKGIWVRWDWLIGLQGLKGNADLQTINWTYVSFLLQLSNHLVHFHICTVFNVSKVDWSLNHCHLWAIFMKLLSFQRVRVWCLTRCRWMQMTMYLGGSAADLVPCILKVYWLVQMFRIVRI